ncbi:MAG: helicase C-terminal domain-containing protein [Bacillota bacterium]
MSDISQIPLPRSFVAIDLETTGLEAGVDQIIEVGAVKVTGDQVCEFHSLVSGSVSIPWHITRLTGISDDMLIQAPQWPDIQDRLQEFIGDCLLVGHRPAFDLGFLQAAGLGLPNPVLDTAELGRMLIPGLGNWTLAHLAHRLAVHPARHHRALDDARTAADVIRALASILGTYPPPVLQYLYNLADGMEQAMVDFIQGSIREILKIFPDAKLGQSMWFLPAPKMGKNLFSQEQLRSQKEGDFKLPEDQIAHVLEGNTTLAGIIPDFESRPQQSAMLKEVSRAFNQRQHLIVEAGTGTGKSLGYLIPAAWWASSAGQRVVVATHTINLQEQLLSKDIPMVERILDCTLRAVLVKGRNNYLCLRKFQQAVQDQRNSNSEENKLLIRLLLWLTSTERGDRGEIALNAQEMEIWLLYAADGETCLSTHCPWYERDCFVTRLRRQSEQAHLLIVNHSLLLTDAKMDNQVLPEYRRLIIDEAHNLEDGATEHLGKSISESNIRQLIRRLQGRPYQPGILQSLRVRWEQAIRADYDARDLLVRIDEGLKAAWSVEESVREFFGCVEAFCQSRAIHEQEGGKYTLRLLPGHEESIWSGVKSGKDNLVFRLRRLADLLNSIAALVDSIYEQQENKTGDAGLLSSYCSQTRELADILDFIVEVDDPEWVYWIDRERRGTYLNWLLKAAPIDVGKLLYPVFAEKDTTVFTSATLSVNTAFDYFIRQTGLNLFPQGKVIQLYVESPFIYRDQSVVCVVQDLPNPAKTLVDDFVRAIAPVIMDIIESVRGRTLVLFTSHHMLRKTYHLVKPEAEKKGIVLLGHYLDGNRWRILQEFQSQENAVVFGANSFWEGVDVPGEKLSCVVIVKLPFRAPGIPAVEARLERFRLEGRDSFSELSVPQAVIRFKQGFGRLIRSKTDRGAVVILDRRVIDMHYGQQFLSSLPVDTHLRASKERIGKQISQWLNGETGP